jgi:ligand-binding sensor domain-containing protein/signal transduction histidine kinase
MPGLRESLGTRKNAGRERGRWIVVCLLCFAVTLRAEHLPVKLYTTADGLARNRVHGILADSRGFMWISTAEGLSLFDGYRFVNYGTRDGLASPVINEVLEARDGTYWVATNEGLCVLHPKGAPHLFTVHHRPGPDFLHSVNVVVQDRTGTIWAGADDGLYRETSPGGEAQSGPQWIDLGAPHNGEEWEVRTILADRQGALWIGGGAGLYRRFPDGRVEAYSTANGLPVIFVEKLLQDTEGRIWAGTRKGLCRLVAEPRPGHKIVERVYTDADGMGDKDIKSLSLAPDGTIWAGTLFGGLSQVRVRPDGRTYIRTYGKAQGLSDATITALAHDREGNLWVGGESAGLMRIVRNGFLTYTKTDGLADDRVGRIFEDRDGVLCVAGNDLAVHRGFLASFDGEKFSRVPYPAGYDWPSLPILQDRTGEWWLGDGGLVRLGRIPLQQISGARALQVFTNPLITDVFRMFEDSSGGIWISSNRHNRVARWDQQGGLLLFPHTNGPQEQLVSAFAEDHAGEIWLGLYGGGVVRYRNNVFTQFGPRDGFPPGFVSNIFVDEAGRLWIATAEGGLGRIDAPAAEHPAVRIYDASHGLTSDIVTSLTADQWGRIYAGTGRGVDRIDPASDRVIHYTINDGLANDTPFSALRDRRGWLWFGTTKGLSRLIPEPEQPSAPPPIRITSLSSAAVPYSVSQLGESSLSGLEFARGDVQVGFSSINFEVGEVLRYQYRIDRAAGKWSVPDDQRSVNLAGLSPGDYRLEVRAVDSRGQVSEQPASIAFRIPPPLWGRTWFRLLCLAAVCLTLYALYRYRLQRLLELEHIRMRIATDLHDDIGSSLSQIAILSEVARRPGEAGADALDPLGGIARISRELVDSMSDIVWAVNPKRDSLRDLTRRMRQFAGEMLVPGGIEFTFDAEAASGHVTLGADLRRQVFLVFKECVNNIARHSGATQVRIVFAMSGGRLRLSIHDNGRGFDARLPVKGHGLTSMTNRAAALGGTLRIKSESGAGTTASLEIPIHRHRIW